VLKTDSKSLIGHNGYVASKSKRCEELSESIAGAEDEINRRVYRLFDLTPREVRILEDETSF